jgi:hypothetical protein
MKIDRRLREFISPTTEALEDMNIEWTLDVSHKHPRLLYSVDGKQFFHVVSRSPSDKRSGLNMKSDVCRNIRQHRGN